MTHKLKFLILLAVMAAGCSGGPSKVSGPGVTTADGLQYWDLKVGSGEMAVPGKTVTVNYTGWLTSGAKFDSNRDRYETFHFVLGRGQVIKGWDEGVVGMKVGGERQLRVPPALAYGSHGNSVIPPDSSLIFEVELLDVK